MPENINKLLEDFTFSKRKTTNRMSCICYIQNKPCHDMKEDELICYLCLCPNYPANNAYCTAKGNKGKYVNSHDKLIWDCSECTINHSKEFVEKYLKSQ